MSQAISPPEPARPDPIDFNPVPARVPNLAHAFLFVALAALSLVVFQGLLLLAYPAKHAVHANLLGIDPRLLIASEALAYVLTLVASALLFPRLWNRGFLAGVQWRWADARRLATRLIPLGFALAFTAQAALVHINPPTKPLPIEEIFNTASTAWLSTVFGSIVAPIFEEIAFRGFLLPAFAIAYDWLCLPRTPVALDRWRSTTTLSPLALIFSAIVTSLFFALLHGQQLNYLVPAMIILFCVSLVLSTVRVRTGSVACSALVHAAYNSLVFLAAIVQTHGYRHLDKLQQ